VAERGNVGLEDPMTGEERRERLVGVLCAGRVRQLLSYGRGTSNSYGYWRKRHCDIKLVVSSRHDFYQRQ
jgi:hypothetical protein